MNWHYQEVEVFGLNDLPPLTTGFIYVIRYTNGTYYLGKKDIYSTKTLPALKNGCQRPDSVRIGKNKGGKRVYFDKVTKEGNWMDYEGSSELTEGLTVDIKYIVEVATSKRLLTYLEAKWLFTEDVLLDESYHNKNILGRFFKGNIE